MNCISIAVSESRPGEPPNWRVVEVVSTEDPEKWRKKVDQLQKLGVYTQPVYIDDVKTMVYKHVTYIDLNLVMYS